MKYLLRNLLDSHAASVLKGKLHRDRRYSNSTQQYTRPHPENAPGWSFVEQTNIVFDTDIEVQNEKTEEEKTEETEEETKEENKDKTEEEVVETVISNPQRLFLIWRSTYQKNF